MKRIGIAVASAALLAALAAPAGAAVVAPHACYGHRSWNDRGDCYDEHRPQHDGGGSILF